MIMLGQAWQMQQIPLSRQAIEAAIRLNGAAVNNNLKAFALGRALALGRLDMSGETPPAFDLEAFIAARVADLVAYQDAAYAETYRAAVTKVKLAESALGVSGLALTEAVARNYFKLMAYKDEYEVARLYNDPAFKAMLEAEFKDTKAVHIYLAPPLFAPKDPLTGLPRKIKFGAWIFGAFKLLAGLKGLRGTPFDPFDHTSERKIERQLVADYGALVDEMLSALNADNHAKAVAMMAYAQAIKGFGHIKHKNFETAQKTLGDLKSAFYTPKKASTQKGQNHTDKEEIHV
jgi:indolepyruvate ferredoxin oxidoreductase